MLGTLVYALGAVLDHIGWSRYPLFGTPAEQVRHHGTTWLGNGISLAAVIWALRGRTGNRGYVLLLVGNVAFALTQGWHFWEHDRRRDSDVTHASLAAATAVMVAGLAWTAIEARGRRPAPPTPAVAPPP